MINILVVESKSQVYISNNTKNSIVTSSAWEFVVMESVFLGISGNEVLQYRWLFFP